MNKGKSYGNENLGGNSFPAELPDLLAKKLMLEQRINEIVNGNAMPAVFTHSVSTDQFEMSFTYRRVVSQNHTTILAPINQLIDQLDDSDFGEEYSKNDLRNGFDSLFNGKFDNPIYKEAQKKLIRDFKEMNAKNVFGNLKLNRFLHVIGFLIKKEVLSINPTNLVNIRWFSEYDPKYQDTLRTYVSKGKSDSNNPLTPNQQCFLEEIFL